MDKVSVLEAGPRIYVEIRMFSTIFSARAYRLSGRSVREGVAFFNVPAPHQIPLEIVAVDSHNPRLGVCLAAQIQGHTWYLTESPYARGSGSGPVFKMSQDRGQAVRLYLHFNPEENILAMKKASGEAFTLDTRGSGQSFQAFQGQNKPPIHQNFSCKLTREVFAIKNPDTDHVFTCMGAAPGSLVTAIPDVGSKKQRWTADFERGMLLHNATGLALDVAQGLHQRLCINTPNRNSDTQRWLFQGTFLVQVRNALVCTGHERVKNLTLEPRGGRVDPRHQKWVIEIGQHVEE
ncbi:hypothetical protein H8L32_02380 [Undibacterium sp. CY18W]|uniref:Ricin B lectin domain-containing protein n=1 Tax=Undibacterium hunanense TaxID=2762292 RepID=A0ABR6ZKA6_9BURK|nr:hypothetical protein [Undibacterium hunanense]MBC3916324.1 hypothetical protein [Undibacterium hunanense]